MHCHPWNTPPYQEAMNRHNSMLCNLPPSLQLEKLQCLHETLHRRFERPPLAFRSGRWGFGHETAGILASWDADVDTSITPYTSWTDSRRTGFFIVLPACVFLLFRQSFQGVYGRRHAGNSRHDWVCGRQFLALSSTVEAIEQTALSPTAPGRVSREPGIAAIGMAVAGTRNAGTIGQTLATIDA